MRYCVRDREGRGPEAGPPSRLAHCLPVRGRACAPPAVAGLSGRGRGWGGERPRSGRRGGGGGGREVLGSEREPDSPGA